MAYVKTLQHEEKWTYRAILEVLCNASDPNALIHPYNIEEHEWMDDITFGHLYTSETFRRTSSIHQGNLLEKGWWVYKILDAFH